MEVTDMHRCLCKTVLKSFATPVGPLLRKHDCAVREARVHKKKWKKKKNATGTFVSQTTAVTTTNNKKNKHDLKMI